MKRVLPLLAHLSKKHFFVTVGMNGYAEVYTAAGRRILQKKISGLKALESVLPGGIYIMKLRTATGLIVKNVCIGKKHSFNYSYQSIVCILYICIYYHKSKVGELRQK